MIQPVTLQNLLPSEMAFISAMQQLGFGRIEFLQIRDGELVFNPGPTTVRDIKFGSPVTLGKPSASPSELCPQVAEFFNYVRDVEAGEIREVEVRHGLPFSMEIELPGAKSAATQGGRRG